MANAQDAEQATDFPLSPLTAELRSDDDIEWAGWGQIPIAANFEQPQIEYAAIHKAAALVHRPELGLLRAAGKDRLAFLNNLLTQGLADLPAGTWKPAMLLNLKGRIVSVLDVVNEPAGDASLLVAPRDQIAMLIDAMGGYLFAEDVQLTDASEQFELLQLHGPTAPDVLNEAADGETIVAGGAVTEVRMAGQSILCWRDDVTGKPGLNLLVPADAGVATWNDLVTRFGQTTDDRSFGQRRLTPTGWAMFNACRIEAGRPIPGVDFGLARPSKPGPKRDDDDQEKQINKAAALPAETGPLFERCVSTTSGCYLGQEVVARMHARGQFAKTIVGLRMKQDALPSAGAPVELDDNTVGVVTSSTLSPVLSGACLALATLKKPHFELGTTVLVPAEGRRVEAEVVPLPFR